MKIAENVIPLIEKALGFELYEWQKAYLLNEPVNIPKERAAGKTVAYIIKLLLTNKEPINIKHDAHRYKDHPSSHYTHWFRSEMKNIDDKLTSVGLITCSVKAEKNPSRAIHIGVEMDTDKLQLKLRAIAKHAEALADELECIDNDWRCDDCGSYNFSTLFSDDLAAYQACSECGKKVESDELPTKVSE